MSEMKLVCFGDSITWGFPLGPRDSWVEVSARELGFPLINKGVNGDTVEDLVRRFPRDVVGHAPTHVMIMIGTNDAAIGVSLAAYQAGVVRLHTMACENGISVILGLPIPSDDRLLENTLQKYRDWLRLFAQEHNIPVVDFAPAMQSAEGCFNWDCYTDEVHPGKKGYENMARLFLKFQAGILDDLMNK